MNLLEEDVLQNNNNENKKTKTFILIAIVVVIFIIIGIFCYLLYVKSSMLKLNLNGVSNSELKNLLVFEEDGNIYVPIKEVAKYFDYESYNGEYNNVSEEPSKCYIQNENEIVNFSLGSSKIYKIEQSKNTNGDYINIENPVKAINGILYATTDTIEKAFNVSFQYDKESNTITIYTLPFLVESYKNIILNYGYAELSEDFSNQKAILENILIVKKDDEKNKYGAIDPNGNTILEPKYDKINYQSKTGDFLVEVSEKFGIISSNKQTKVQIIYSSIETLDSDLGLYIVKNEKNKYGVIDTNGNIKIYIENDEIGMDISKFKENNIKNSYIFMDNLIPVRKDKLWGLYDKDGNMVANYEYDSFGYIASNNKNALNLIVIPKYNVLVACKDKKYTLINSSGQKLFEPVADDIYMTINGKETHYYINVNGKQVNAEDYLDRKGIKAQD